jgi:hypothetical protein
MLVPFAQISQNFPDHLHRRHFSSTTEISVLRQDQRLPCCGQQSQEIDEQIQVLAEAP